MKINELWLRQYVNPQLNSDELAHQITMAGLEVDSVEPVLKQPLNHVVVGQVVSVAPHPDADRLKVTMVEVGQDAPLQIVCGASNVVEGIKVPVALQGAVLPNNIHIKKGKLRGVDSFGMLCGAEEIGLTSNIDGLLVLPNTLNIGEDITQALALNDMVYDISITPNRADCLSARGLIREIGVLNNLTPNPINNESIENTIFNQLAEVAVNIPDVVNVNVIAENASPRYLARIIKNIDNTVATPLWIASRLQRAGMRLHNIIVDITNYVLLELGQPLHAFDLTKTGTQLEVRFAQQGEPVTLLNEEKVTLDKDVLVIANSNGVQALAGIMGGLESSVTNQTTDIILESAFFDPISIAGRARRYGLHTDASARFERGVDYELPLIAMQRASQLLQQYTGAMVGAITTTENTEYLPLRNTINISLLEVNRALGFDVSADFIESQLKQLGFDVKKLDVPLPATALQNLSNPANDTQWADTQWTVTPPSWRFDINIKEDINEEIARLYGYDNIPVVLPQQAMQLKANDTVVEVDQLKTALAANGYQEVVSFSFGDPATQEAILNQPSNVVLQNPISSELSVMRETLLTSLIPIMQHNINRQQTRLRLFEEGLRFTNSSATATDATHKVIDIKSVQQIPTLAIVAAGDEYNEQWQQKSSVIDFYSFKQDVMNLLSSTKLNVALSTDNLPSWLHPGQAAQILVQADSMAVEQNQSIDSQTKDSHSANQPLVLGYMGRLHPAIEKRFGLLPTYFAELDINTLQQPIALNIAAPAKFPAVRRDLAMVIANQYSYADVQNIIKQYGGKDLKQINVFDVYSGQGIEADKRSLAMSLVWQSSEHTLEEDEIKQYFDSVINGLTQDVGAILRG